MNTIRALVALTLVVSATSADARQARSTHARTGAGRGGQMLSFWGVLDPGPIDGVGLGARVMLPIVPGGLLGHPRVRDEIALEIGADVVHYEARGGYWGYYYDYSWNGVLPVVGAAWNFWFTPHLALYPKVDVGWWFGWYGGPDPGYGRADFDGAFVQGAVGLIYRFQRASLRVELGSGLLRLGFGVPF